jgi:hypothetical protein
MVIWAAQCCAAEIKSPPRFEVFRVAIDDQNFPESAFSESGAKWCREHVTQDYLADNLRTVGQPILTDADVSEFCWDRQWLRLTDVAAAQWDLALREHRSLAGEFFVVLVDDAFCYAGIIWSLASSQSPPPVPIMHEMTLNGVLMTNVSGDILGTPQDVRYDERIERAFGQLGKLRPECAEDWWK